MKKIIPITFLALAALAACATNPTTTNLETVKQPAIDTKKTQVLGILEVELSSEKGSVSSVKFIEAGNAGGLRAQGTAVPINSSNWVFTPGVTTYMSDGTYKYLQNTISIENKTDTIFQNLVMYAINTPSSVGGTAFTAIKTLSGTPLTGMAASNVARSIVPTHGMINPTTVDPEKASLMLFTPSEAAAVQAQLVSPNFTLSNPAVLEYGFRARKPGFFGFDYGFDKYYPDCEEDCGKGEITWAFKFPLSLPNSSNLGKFTLRYVVANEPGQFAMQSIEDQGASTIGGRPFNFLNPYADLRIFPGSDRAETLNLKPLCRVKIAKTPNQYMGSSNLLSSSGSLDACFGATGRRILEINRDSEVKAVKIQNDGKILVAGTSFRRTGDRFATGINNFTLIRLNFDGSIDKSFVNSGIFTTDVTENGIRDISLMSFQVDGKTLVTGLELNGISLTRFNADGSPDVTFGFNGTTRTPANNSTGITPGQNPRALKLQTDGKIIIAMISDDITLIRYDSTGHLDSGFGSSGIVKTNLNGFEEGVIGIPNGIDVQTDGKIVISGTTNLSTYSSMLIRYNTNGDLDLNFGTNGIVIINSSNYFSAEGLKIQPNGKILALGKAETSNGNYGFSAVQFDPSGQIDSSFGLNGQFLTEILGYDFATAKSAAIQNDGKIVIVGRSNTYTSSYRDKLFAMVRLNVNGTLDTSFDSDGMVTTSFDRNEGDQTPSVIIQPDGKILLAGSSGNKNFEPGNSDSKFALARYNP